MARPVRRAQAPSRPRWWRDGWLPRGRALSEHDTAARHRVVLMLLTLHLPALLVLGALAGRPLPGTLLDLALPAALLAAALAPLGRRPRALAAALGLLTCSAVLVHLLDGRTEAHFHYFVVVAVLALYQDWSVHALAAAFVVVEGLLPGRDELYRHPGPAWPWVVVQLCFVLAESGALILFRRADEQAHEGEERLQAALWEGQRSVRERLDETERIRTDLIGTVSHEFRTPLTGIRGAALTVLKRGDRLDEVGRRQLLQGIVQQQERLSRLLENMLTAARATAADPGAVAEVDAVAAEVAMLAGGAGMGRPPVSLVVEQGLAARIDRHALHQVLANLVDNAHQHGTPGAVPLLAAGRDGVEVWVTVSNEGALADVQAATLLFEPFTQGDAGATRGKEGLGMGLYVVRRLVEVYGGRLLVRADEGWVTVTVRLPAAGADRSLVVDLPRIVQTPAPTALPTR